MDTTISNSLGLGKHFVEMLSFSVADLSHPAQEETKKWELLKEPSQKNPHDTPEGPISPYFIVPRTKKFNERSLENELSLGIPSSSRQTSASALTAQLF
jgi:hypothetical protein